MKYVSGGELASYLINDPKKYSEYVKKRNELREYVGSMIVGNTRPTISSLCFQGNRLRYNFKIVDAGYNDPNIGFLANSLPVDRVRAMYFTNRVYETFLGDKYSKAVIRKQFLKEEGVKNVTIPSLLSLETSYHLYNYYKQIQETISSNQNVRFRTPEELDSFLKIEKAKYVLNKDINFYFTPSKDISLENKPVLPGSKVKKIYEERLCARNSHCKTLFEPYARNGLELQEYLVSRIRSVNPSVSEEDIKNIEKNLENERLFFCRNANSSDVSSFLKGTVSDVLQKMDEKEAKFAMASTLERKSKNNVYNVDGETTLYGISNDMKTYLSSRFEGVINSAMVKDYINGLEERQGIVKQSHEDLVPYRFATNSKTNAGAKSSKECEGQLDIFSAETKIDDGSDGDKLELVPDLKDDTGSSKETLKDENGNPIIIDKDGQCRLF